MLDKDKLILIYYYGFSKYADTYTISSQLNHCNRHFEEMFDDSVKMIVLPVFDTLDHKIEYINKDKLNKDELSRLENSIEKFKQIILNNTKNE